MGAVRRRIKSFVAIVATIVLAVGVVGSGIYFWRESRSRAKYSESGLTLPAAYHESPEQIGVIGRLALLEVAATEEREVSVNHRWQTGDTFRVVVSANHAGWLYLFHRPPNGELTLLWPEDETETKANAIRPREPLKVPKGEDVFQFVGGTGLETFYVALSAEPEVPEPGLDSPQNRVQAAEEFITRSLGSPESLSRDVIIARPQLSELYLYFAPADPGDVVAVDFQLQHREGAY